MADFRDLTSVAGEFDVVIRPALRADRVRLRLDARHHSTRYRAITSGALSRAAEDAGFKEISWLSGENAGFHQPVMTAVNRPDEEKPHRS